MLKFCLNKDNQEIKYQEITLPLEEFTYSTDSSAISGVFDRKYKINNGDTMAFLTPNVETYTDIEIETHNVMRTGYFTNNEEFEIHEVTDYINASDSYLLTQKTLNLSVYEYKDNKYTKTSSSVTYDTISWIKLTRRYVQMPNGNIYYELYKNNGSSPMPSGYEDYYKVEYDGSTATNTNGYFYFNIYSYNESSSDTTTLSKITVPIKYYVDSNTVTYNNIEYDFEENYDINPKADPSEMETGDAITFPITDEYGTLIATLTGYTEYTNPIPLTHFSLEKPEDLTIEYTNIVPASKFFFINYKNEKYDFEFVNGYWQVTLPNDLCECVESDSATTVVYEREGNLTYVLDSDLGLYPTTIMVNNNRLPVLQEYRTTIDGEYLFIYTDSNYSFTTNDKLVCKIEEEEESEYDILSDVNGDLYINYCNRRVYLEKDKYIFTISKFQASNYIENGSIKEHVEGCDNILEEFEVTITESEFKKFTAGTSCRVTYIDEFGNSTPWFVQPEDGSDSMKRDRAYKIGNIIEYNNGVKELSAKTVTDEYKFNVYRYCTINNVNFRANYTKRVGDDEKYRDDAYRIIKDTTTHEYPLTVLETNDNFFVCQVDIDYIHDIIDYESTFKNDTDVNSLQLMFSQRYRDINSMLVNYESVELAIKNNAWGIDEEPTALISYEENVLDEDFFHLYKKLNYFSFPIRLGSDVENNLHQEEIVNEDFYKVEKDKSVNKIIDMEKDIYFPVIYKKEKTYENVYEIKFNLHFRTRDLETWKIKEKTYSAYTESVSENLTMDNWNIIDNYHQKKKNSDEYELKTKLTKDEIFSGDLVYFLNFTEDDIFYQKSRVGNSFLRLLFYDSPDENSQNLLHMSTVFLNENELYKKYINNIDNEIYRIYNNRSGETFTYCNVNTEPISADTDGNFLSVDYSQDRLDCSFSITNRDETDTSSEGFYIYMFKEYGYKLRPSEVYMKVEFNHAGQGKVLQFFMPTITNEGKLTCMVNDDTSKEITALTGNSFTQLKNGLPLNQVFNYQYIKFNVVYDESKHRYVYYVDPTYCQAAEWNNNIMVFNLWEIKFQDES